MKPHRQWGAHKREVVRHKCLRLHLSVAPPLCLSWIHNTFSLSMLILCSSLFPLHPPIHLFHPSPTSPFSFYIFIFVLSSFISPLVLSLSTPHLLAGWLGVCGWVCVSVWVWEREREQESVFDIPLASHTTLSHPLCLLGSHLTHSHSTLQSVFIEMPTSLQFSTSRGQTHRKKYKGNNVAV